VITQEDATTRTHFSASWGRREQGLVKKTHASYMRVRGRSVSVAPAHSSRMQGIGSVLEHSGQRINRSTAGPSGTSHIFAASPRRRWSIVCSSIAVVLPFASDSRRISELTRASRLWRLLCCGVHMHDRLGINLGGSPPNRRAVPGRSGRIDWLQIP